jgi:hypothetical protein
VEGGQQEPALPEVLVLVQREHRPGAEDGAERVLAGVQHGRVSGEDRLQEVGMAEDDPEADPGQRDRERVAVASLQGGEERPAGEREEPGADHGREARARRQVRRRGRVEGGDGQLGHEGLLKGYSYVPDAGYS